MTNGNDLETRELAYFVVLAEELHFGRAATRLSIAQPGLSKAIRRLESRLGLSLFERHSRGVSLTPSGASLLQHGRRVLAAAEAAVEYARRAALVAPPLRLVLKAGGDGNLLPVILAAYAERPGAREVEVVFGGVADRVDFLHRGRADLAILYAPFDDLSGLGAETLLVEDRVAVLPRRHPLAGREDLVLADLADETMPRWRGMEEDGEGPEVDDMAQLSHLIAAGRAIAILPPSAIGLPRPDLVGVPIADAAPNRLVIAWADFNDSPDVRAFVETATAVARPRPRVAEPTAG